MNWQIPRAVIERDPNWSFSLGEDINKLHWRKGKLHATCHPSDSICMIHKDSHDPHQFPIGTLKHLWDWSPPATIAGALAVCGLAAYGLYRSRSD